jgi:hypothetical protein
VFAAKGGEEFLEIGLRFGGEDAKGSGETVARVVQGSGGFSGIALWTGR